jgi:DNA-binding SARP family transcriptional activator
VLGPLEAWVEQHRQQLGGPRQERVLAVLLLEANRVVPVYRLVDAAWAEEPPTTASHQVRKMVADLRRRLPAPGTTIVTDGPGYRLVIGDDQLDLRMFELRLARAREAESAGLVSNAVTQLQAALDLWRGPALGGLDGPVIRPAAESLDERRMGALERLMDLRLSLGEARDLIGDLRALLADHPLREALRGQLMLALYRAGRQAEALGVYDEGRRLLADELGIDPGPELVRRHEDILRNDPELDLPRPEQVINPVPVAGAAAAASGGIPPPSTLPYDLSDFSGRADELEALLGIVEKAPDRTPTVITVDGMAGVGKTTLAVHAAHRLAERFPDGQLFVDLHGYTPGREPVDPAEALSTLLAALGVPGDQVPLDVVSRSAAWRVQAAGRRLLVLLDNAANTAQVRPLLPGAGSCLVLVTSRSRLGLDGAVPLSVVLPTDADALSLVGRLLGKDRLAGEPAEVAQLIEACGRLPLAMRIAATRLNNRPQWTVSYLVARLRREERRLGELALDDRSVEAAVGLSYRGLNDEQQRMFRLLGLHPGTDFDPYAAAALAGTDRESAEIVLEDLLDARLLLQRQLGRYTFHDLLRSYAQGAARADPDREGTAAAVRRLVDYYLCAADSAADLIQPGRFRIELPTLTPAAEVPVFADRTEAMAWFDAERSTLLAVARYAVANGLDLQASHFPRAIAMYLLLRGHIQDETGLLEAGIEAAHRLGDRGSEMRTLFILVVALWHVGRFRDAQERANQGLAIATEIADRRGEAVCLSRIGMLYTELGQYVESLDYNTRALEIHRETNDRQEQRTTLNSISYALAALGRYQEALDAAQQAVAIERELAGNSSGAAGLMNAAIAQAGLGDLDGALTTLDEAAGLARQVGSVGVEAEVAAQTAEVYRRLGRFDEAYRSGRRALDIVWAIERPTITAVVENILGAVHRDRGEYEQALERHRRARELAERSELRIEVARADEGIGHSLAALGDRPASRQHWLRALELYEAMSVPEAEPLRANLRN